MPSKEPAVPVAAFGAQTECGLAGGGGVGLGTGIIGMGGGSGGAGGCGCAGGGGGGGDSGDGADSGGDGNVVEGPVRKKPRQEVWSGGAHRGQPKEGGFVASNGDGSADGAGGGGGCGCTCKPGPIYTGYSYGCAPGEAPGSGVGMATDLQKWSRETGAPAFGAAGATAGGSNVLEQTAALLVALREQSKAPVRRVQSWGRRVPSMVDTSSGRLLLQIGPPRHVQSAAGIALQQCRIRHVERVRLRLEGSV